LMLAGFSLPVSEELMLVVGGVMASSIIPEHTFHLFFAVFLGCYFSDWIAYWLGRLMGSRLYHVKWLQFALSEKRVKRLAHFYERYGFLTLFFGRFIPFGVRNGIFMTAGVGKMHFGKFALIDAIGCLFFSASLFYLAYSFGQNYETLCQLIQVSNGIIFALFTCLIVATGLYLWLRRRAPAAVSPTPVAKAES
ncbi:MAG TPA: DedA family protein, partial [Chlamydiales bacterium]|nr:DedA family protein [Chlamydiales bacterium]